MPKRRAKATATKSGPRYGFSSPVIASRIKDHNAAAELIIMIRDRDGVAMPENVVEAAKPKASPIHNVFPWDDKIAGHQWRLHLARNLCNSLRVIVENEEGEEVEERVLVHVEEPLVGYQEIDLVATDDSLSEKVMIRARQDLTEWLGRYHALEKRLPSLFRLAKTFAFQRVQKTG